MKTKTAKINKHPDWRLSKAEKNWYYLGDTARLFGMTLVGSYMTLFLMFQGVSTASVATAILIVKIIDAIDDVLFGCRSSVCFLQPDGQRCCADGSV